MVDLPALNATLNATSAVLIALGWKAIRTRRMRLHQFCMTAAFAVSILFLTCYLYYHIVIKGGEPTKFPAVGKPRTIYLAILISHTCLAMAVAIMAPLTMWYAYRGSLTRHVRLARWTMPIWLYVSVTGVIVYWMLYRMFPPTL